MSTQPKNEAHTRVLTHYQTTVIVHRDGSAGLRVDEYYGNHDHQRLFYQEFDTEGQALEEARQYAEPTVHRHGGLGGKQ